MDVGPTLIANPQPAELVYPGQSPLHHPPVDTQAAPVLGEPLGQNRFNPQGTQGTAVGFRVISPVSLDLVRSTTGPSPLPPNWRYGLYQGRQLGHIMPVGLRQGGG
jgi:hypothetical protein